MAVLVARNGAGLLRLQLANTLLYSLILIEYDRSSGLKLNHEL